MTRGSGRVPFTVAADLDLGATMAPWLRAHGADVTIRRGVVPETLPDAESEGVAWQYARNRLLIVPPCGVRFLVEGGTTIRYAVEAATAADVRLFLLGSAWAALALQRGLLPMHMSAVCSAGRDVHAFTGPPGAGKSTLAAALGGRGYPFFADDVLILDPAAFGKEARCYGHRDCKLWPDALALTGIEGLERVREAEGFDKVHAEPPRPSPHAAGRLRSLHVLVEARSGVGRDDSCRLERLAGREAVEALGAAVYRLRFTLHILGARRTFRSLAALGRHVDVFLFHRPTVARRFREGVGHLAAALPPIPGAAHADGGGGRDFLAG